MNKKNKKDIINPYCYKEKLEYIKKKHDIFFQSNNRIRQQSFIIRGWCITLMIGYVSFIIKRYDNCFNLFLPVFIFPLFFLLLEGFLESNCKRTSKRIEKIDKIFKIQNEKYFRDAVEKYNFPSSDEFSPKRLSLYKKFEIYCSALSAPHLLLWYSTIGIMPIIFVAIIKLSLPWGILITVSMYLVLFTILYLQWRQRRRS